MFVVLPQTSITHSWGGHCDAHHGGKASALAGCSGSQGHACKWKTGESEEWSGIFPIAAPMTELNEPSRRLCGIGHAPLSPRSVVGQMGVYNAETWMCMTQATTNYTAHPWLL